MVLVESSSSSDPMIFEIAARGEWCCDLPAHLSLLHQSLQRLELHQQLESIAALQPHYTAIIVQSYIQRILDAHVDVNTIANYITTHIANPMIWLAQQLFERKLRPLALQIIEWVIAAVEKVKFIVQLISKYQMANVIMKMLEHIVKIYRDWLHFFLAADLVDAAMISPCAVKTSLNSYHQLIVRETSYNEFLKLVRMIYHSCSENAEKLPCQAQVMANLGTGLISHKPSYKAGEGHVQLAQICFEEALQLLPSQVCCKQLDHLKKNIRVAKLVPGVIRIFNKIAEVEEHHHLSSAVSNVQIQCDWLNHPFSRSRDMKDLSSAIKFALQMTDVFPKSSEKNLVQMLIKFSSFFQISHPEFSQKCSDWSEFMSRRSS